MTRFASCERAARGAVLSALVLSVSHCSSDGASSLGAAGVSANAGAAQGVSGSANGGGGPAASGGVAGFAGSASGGAGSSTASSGASNGGTAGGGAAGGGTAGASHGGAANGGTSNGGAAGTVGGGGGASGGLSNGGAAGTVGGGGQGGTTAFTCNLVLGVSPTGQWFDSGFLSLVAADHWESIWVAHHYTSFWADPADSAWTTAFDPYPGPAHQCAEGAKTPDRVLFVAVNWTYTTANQWEADLTRIVQNLQVNYPKLRRIELMTLTRAPGNVVCAQGGSSSETIIPAWTDVAIAAMVAKYPALVVAAPKFEVPHCSDFMGGGTAPQYTNAGAQDVAQLIGTYYAAHP